MLVIFSQAVVAILEGLRLKWHSLYGLLVQDSQDLTFSQGLLHIDVSYNHPLDMDS